MLNTIADQIHFHRRKTCAPVQDGIEHHGCQRQDYWPFFAIFNVRYWSLMLSAFRHFIITDWRGVFCQHSR
ncbi:type VI secretion system tip protein VgrG, partial [Escherichia coli]